MPSTPPADFSHLREQAERARRLAQTAGDEAIRERLLALADDYEARAVGLQDGEETRILRASEPEGDAS